jgi:hypothetical protein
MALSSRALEKLSAEMSALGEEFMERSVESMVDAEKLARDTSIAKVCVEKNLTEYAGLWIESSMTLRQITKEMAIVLEWRKDDGKLSEAKAELDRRVAEFEGREPGRRRIRTGEL